MAIKRRSQPTYFVSQNKHIYLWDSRLAHTSNVRVVRNFKLIDNINFKLKKESNLVEISVNREKSDTDDPGNNL